MASKIQISVEKTFDRGPEYGYLEVQVNFEGKATTTRGPCFASVIVSLPKPKVGSMSFDEIRKMARAEAISFLEEGGKIGEVSE